MAVFIDVLRCMSTLYEWSKHIKDETGTPAIRSFSFQEPDSTTAVGQLWRHAGVFPYGTKQDAAVSFFQSRYITPIVWITRQNQSETIQAFTDWIDYIADRLNVQVGTDLIGLIREITINLVNYQLVHGHFCISIWPSGQVEVIWTRPVNFLHLWRQEEDPVDYIHTSQRRRKEGGEIAYIYEHLLPMYNGVLVINHLGANYAVNSYGIHSLESHSSRDRNSFFPNSDLFTLHLFCPDIQRRR